MRIFPIYESCVLFNFYLTPGKRQSKYICMSAGDAHIIVCLHEEQPINIRWFTDTKEYNRFINTIKASYKNYEEFKEAVAYCTYPSPQEDVPF